MYDTENGGTRHVELAETYGGGRVLDGPQLHALRQMGLRVEEFFGKPQDIEWAIRGEALLLLQSRPVTTS
jgi:pyruvate,water dikinase